MRGIGSTFFYCISQLLRGRACFQRSDNAFGQFKRHRLDIVKRGDLRLFLTKMKLDIDKLMAVRQPHQSH